MGLILRTLLNLTDFHYVISEFCFKPAFYLITYLLLVHTYINKMLLGLFCKARILHPSLFNFFSWFNSRFLWLLRQLYLLFFSYLNGFQPQIL